MEDYKKVEAHVNLEFTIYSLIINTRKLKKNNFDSLFVLFFGFHPLLHAAPDVLLNSILNRKSTGTIL